MKYSKAFERDWSFYSNKDNQNFKTSRDVKLKEGGLPAKEVFFKMDSHGLKDLSTSEPELLIKAITAKEMVNMQVDLWSDGIAEGSTFYFEVDKWIDELGYPIWTKKAVEMASRRKIAKGKPAHIDPVPKIYFIESENETTKETKE